MNRYWLWLLVFVLSLPVYASVSTLTKKSYITFSINIQDFAYPEKSKVILNKIISLHERHRIPVDFFLTDTMAIIFADQFPALLSRMKTSPVVAISYQVRPPKPYYNRFDWLGLKKMSPATMYQTIWNYETHAIDLITGEYTNEAGGYQDLANRMGYSPYVVGALSAPEVASTVSKVFRQLGARFLIEHGRGVNIGEKRDHLYIKPEHVDLRLFSHVGEDAETVIETAISEASQVANAKAPYFIGIKMHDNDFFAEKSAWLTVYGNDKQPPWDASVKSNLLPEDQQTAMWQMYRDTVRYVASIQNRVTPVNAPLILSLEEGALYVSGTMHIESKRSTWPDPGALIDFFTRATATGMRWSIGADLGWLQGEPKARDLILATESLGVEWDIHAHHLADRAKCASTILKLGGHPNQVASGLTASEIDSLRNPLTWNGTMWEAEILWGIARQARHGVGSDDRAFGVWKPASSADFTKHDPNGNLIAIGGGTLNLADIEALANERNRNDPPVISASIMVQPGTLTLVGTTDGIETIEAFAARMSKRSGVRWATISETAAAWVAAGEIPSRVDSFP